ncbi:hypothetical protein [Cupriavidus necator]
MNAALWLSHARKLARGVLPVLLASPCSHASEVSSAAVEKTAVHASQGGSTRHQFPHLRSEDRLGDLLRHPAFQGFSHRMLPWDGRAYDEAMRLKDIDQLLPYHTHVEADVVVGSLNRMVDDANAGRTVFYDFHIEEEKSEPGVAAYRPVLLSWQARRALRRHRARRWLFLRRLRA